MPEIDSTKIVSDFFDRVSEATDVVHIMVAGNIAREELLGIAGEPYPD